MKALALCAALLLGGLFTHLWEASELADARAELVGLKGTHAQELADERAEGIRRLNAAQALSDKLQFELAASEDRLSTIKKDTQREIQRATTGRACLGSVAVGLLNDAAADRSPTVPAPVSRPAEADAAFASDTDVATWANQAIEQYNTCRKRLDALIDWYLQPFNEPPENNDD